MPNISYDAQSFLIDGRRVWLVSGAIHFARVPRELWRRRIRAAKQAGLNCIETYVFWNAHEPRPGVFTFEGDLDLRAFVQTVHEEGMYCILRPGPYTCAEWDFGGLPAWLHRIEGMKLREANGPFLEACARYLTAVMEQVKGLQVTDVLERGPGSAGPIIMVQAENEWICHNPEQADTYLREIVRYLRENGCTVPVNVCNNLWQRVDGAIDTWNACEHLSADLRQLRVVQPNAPRFVTEFWTGWFDQWGGPHHTRHTADWNLHRLASILASGAQYNLFMFHGGTNFGFYGGRSVASPDCFMTTSYDYDAPLLEAGGRGEKYRAVKRISVFASQFGQLFAGLDATTPPPAAVAVDQAPHPLSVISQSGSMGDVIFVFRADGDKTANVNVLLPNGLTMPVPLGDDRVAWFVLNANLGGVATLTHTNLRPWAFVDRKMLVLFGPAGAEGLISINGSAWSVRVPEDRAPIVEHHEGVTVVVLNGEQLDAAYLYPGGLVIGAASLDDHDRPVALDGWPHMTTVTSDGVVARLSAKPARTPAAPRLGAWHVADVDDMLDGASESFKPIDGPASLESLKCDFGYGWYRITQKNAQTGNAFAPESGDRLHVYSDRKLQTIIGLGPGASPDPARLRLDTGVTLLADNLGRFNFGWNVGETKGLFGHIHDVRPLQLGKPKLVSGMSPDPFEMRGYWVYLRRGDRVPADAWTWKINARKGRPLFLDLWNLPQRVMLLANNKPVGMYDPTYTAGYSRFALAVGKNLRKGTNLLTLALFGRHDGKTDPRKFIRLYESTAEMTGDAQWAFAPWQPPADDAFRRAGQSAMKRPAWFRTTFNISSTMAPLWLEPHGMSKGQLYLNGHNIGRYFVATAEGKPVPPQERYFLPEPWLHADKPNELLIFDEHGRPPQKCRLVYDAMGPYGK
ncbi:MAG: beta-galactosidase [Planctomycetes bacterium]|nr:beta-galactosidase [Planctomycetota bacterium]